MRHRSTNRCGAVFARAKGSSSRLSLAVTVTVIDFGPTRSSSEDHGTMILTQLTCNQRPAISAEDILIGGARSSIVGATAVCADAKRWTIVHRPLVSVHW
jgi:hypothetical protein